MKILLHYFQAYLAYRLKRNYLNYSPILVSIEPTNICNFKCSFCNQSSPDHFNERKAGMMEMANYEIILKKIRIECPDVKIISLTLDGEPTLHKDLPEMIEKANRDGLSVIFSSNGSKFNREFLENTKNLSYQISTDFSLDKDGFENYRGYKGSWSVVYNNLIEIMKYLKINNNLHLQVTENSAYYDGLDKADTNLKSLQRHFKKYESPRLTYALRNYHKIVDGALYGGSSDRYHGCYYPWLSLTIAWNGDVVTCCRDLDGKYILGNIIESSIIEIWNGPKALKLRQAVLDQNLDSIPSCGSCDLPYDSQKNKWAYKILKILRRERVH
ncbi:MAG: radical SAM/SPASM domain-containing protein [Nitrospiria bacterium]